jgi:hypothetical protein
MAANGISTLASKSSRRAAKIALAESKRQAIGTNGYRLYNFYIGTVSPTPSRPWSQFRPAPHDAEIDTQDGDSYFATEDDLQLITE